MAESPVILTINVSEDFIAKLAEAIALVNLRAGGVLPGSSGTPSASEASQPLHGGSETAPVDPWATGASEFNATRAEDTWPSVPAATFKPPAEDPFGDAKTRPADPWASDPLADAIQHAADLATLKALWEANRDKWTDEYTKLAEARKDLII